MEDLSFDIGGILSEEEANKLFEENDDSVKEAETETEQEQEQEHVEEEEQTRNPEEVDVVENESVEDANVPKDDGSSPNIYSSIATALKDDGIFPDFEDVDLSKVQTAEDFAELFEEAITSRLDERQRRIDAALGAGVAPDQVRMYEQTLQYLGSINAEALSAENEEAENLRKQMIFNELLTRGYSQERANREVEKSFRAGSDIEDAKDALEALTKYYKTGYENIQSEAKKKADAAKAEQQKMAKDIRKSILEDPLSFGENKLDKRTCQRVYDAIAKPIYKDPDTGQLLTAVQKFQKEQPEEFMKQLGLWFVLTDGGKSVEGIAKEQVRAEKNKSIKELERKINSSSLNRDGTLRYHSSSGDDSDPLLSDGWKIGWE